MFGIVHGSFRRRHLLLDLVRCLGSHLLPPIFTDVNDLPQSAHAFLELVQQLGVIFSLAAPLPFAVSASTARAAGLLPGYPQLRGQAGTTAVDTVDPEHEAVTLFMAAGISGTTASRVGRRGRNLTELGMENGPRRRETREPCHAISALVIRDQVEEHGSVRRTRRVWTRLVSATAVLVAFGKGLGQDIGVVVAENVSHVGVVCGLF